MPRSTTGEPRPASLESLLDYLPEEHRPPDPASPQQANSAPVHSSAPAAPSVRSATLTGLRPDEAIIRYHGQSVDITAQVAEELDRELLEDALSERQRVLVEQVPGAPPLIVGVLLVRRPDRIRLAADQVEIEARREITLRTGKAGLRMQADGDIELLGGRISAVSRGVMRLVGRVLRLN